MDKESRDLEMRERFRRRCTRVTKGPPCAVDSIYSIYCDWLKGTRVFREAVECRVRQLWDCVTKVSGRESRQGAKTALHVKHLFLSRQMFLLTYFLPNKHRWNVSGMRLWGLNSYMTSSH